MPPAITIPEEALKFEMRAYIHAGKKLPLPEAHHIGEYKVKLRVALGDMSLDEQAQRRLIYMLGLRYNANKRIITLTVTRAPRVRSFVPKVHSRASRRARVCVREVRRSRLREKHPSVDDDAISPKNTRPSTTTRSLLCVRKKKRSQTERFRNRVENRRYLVYQIESLKLAAGEPDEEFDGSQVEAGRP